MTCESSGWKAVRYRRYPVGFQYLAIVCDLQRYDWAGVCYAARWYSWISPPSIVRRRIRAAAKPVTDTATMSSPLSGGRRFLARVERLSKLPGPVPDQENDEVRRDSPILR